MATCQAELLSRGTALLDAADVKPSVLHGDLWIGNSGLVRGGGVTVFDPAGFIGHSEFGTSSCIARWGSGLRALALPQSERTLFAYHDMVRVCL